MKSLFLLTAALALASGQTPADQARALFDEARLAPIEIFADVVLHDKLLDHLSTKEKVNLLEDVFRRAGEARRQFPLRYVGPAVLAGAALDADRVYQLHLDALSIRCRAIHQLLDIDPKRARELLDQIVVGQVPKPDCAAVFVPDVSVYIETYAEVAGRGAFTAKERDERLPFTLVESSIRLINTSWAITAAAKAFPKFATTPAEAQRLGSALAAALTLSDSDRDFVSAASEGALAANVLLAGMSLRDSDTPLLFALRGYLVRHLTAVRCEDSDPPTVSDLIGSFNATLEDRERTDIQPISDEETEPASRDREADDTQYENGDELDALLAEAKSVARIQVRGTGFVMAMSHNDPYSDDRPQRVLSKILDWKGGSEQDPVTTFHQRLRLFTTLAGVPLTADAQRSIRNAMVGLLEDPGIVSSAPGEWLSEAKAFVAHRQAIAKLRNLIANRPAPRSPTPNGFVLPSADWLPDESDTELARALAASRLPVLSLYGRLALLEKELASK